MEQKSSQVDYDKSRQQHQKIRDAARFLPFLGLLLLLPPMPKIFQQDIVFMGVPLIVAYLFIVWGLLILSALALAYKIREGREDREQQGRDNEISADIPSIENGES